METLDHRTPPARRLSPLYHYWQTRLRLGKEKQLIDLTLRDGLQEAVDSGICADETHSPQFDRDGALTAPSSEAHESARERRLALIDPIHETPAYFRVVGASQWVTALRNRMPLVVGFWVTSSYHAITQDNPVHGPVPLEQSTFGHCVAVLGYHESTSRFLVKDSRGQSWGLNGTWWLPYSAVNADLVESAFALGRILERD
jgi:hypothetical protein